MVSIGDIHIIPNNAQGGIIALALKDPAAHFLRLFLHSILRECPWGNSHNIEYAPVLTYERAVWLDAFGSGFLFLNKTAQSVRYIVRQPCSAEGGIGCQPPYSKLSHIQFHILFEGEQHTGQPVMPEGIGFLEASALFGNAFLCENLIDAIHPFLWVAAAALKNQAFLISHTAELLC